MSRRRRGLTLVELLVVVSIIVLLAAMLVPYMHALRERVYSAICQNNLSQLGVAIHAQGTRNAAALPAGAGWIAAAGASNAQDSLKCPKGYYRGGGTGPLATEDHVVQVPPPPSVEFDALEDATLIRVFTERTDYVLPTDVIVDISEPGRYDGSGDYTATTGAIRAGTIVNCHYVHYDPVGRTHATTSGALAVASDILGLIVVTERLHASDDALALPGTNYPNGHRARGFEAGSDVVVLAEGRRQVQIERFRASYPGDVFRIITAPEGEASYGMNGRIRPKRYRLKQLMLVEYDKPVIDVANDDPARWLMPRHLGRANALFVDGTVRALYPDRLGPDSKLWEP